VDQESEHQVVVVIIRTPITIRNRASRVLKARAVSIYQGYNHVDRIESLIQEVTLELVDLVPYQSTVSIQV
jgi:hypothetical protein